VVQIKLPKLSVYLTIGKGKNGKAIPVTGHEGP
jgi:hypothetical protein